MGNTTIFSGCVSAVTIKNSGLFQITDPRVEELSTVLSENINSKVIIDGVSAQTLSATHISQDDFYQRAATSTLLSNELYVVSSDCINAYGQQIKNLSAATDLSDAVTLEQLQAASSSLSNVLSNYYLKSETSSASELTSALVDKLEANDVSISYDSTARKIVLASKSHTTSVDCNDFIKDGMLSSAELCGTTLVLKFNTAAGSNPISVELSNFVDDYDGKITYLSAEIDQRRKLDDLSVYETQDYWTCDGDTFIYKEIYPGTFGWENTSVEGQVLYYQNGTWYYAINAAEIGQSQGQEDAASIEIPESFSDDVYVFTRHKSSSAVAGNRLATTADLTAYQPAGNYLSSNALANYYQKSETSSATEINNAFELSSGNKVFIDDRILSSAGYSDLSVVKLSASEYEALVSTSAVLSNALYIVEENFEDAYGHQIKNLAPGTDLSDAVNLEQLSNAVSSIQIPTDLSSFTNSPGYTTNIGTITGITMNGSSKGTSGVVNLGTVLTAHQSLSNYYTKSEVSSKSEVETKFNNKAQKQLPAITYSGSLPVGSNRPVISFTELSTSNSLIMFACDQYPKIKLRFDTASNKAQLIYYSGLIQTIAETAGTPAFTMLTFNISSDSHFPAGTNGELILTKNIASVDVAYKSDVSHTVLDTIANIQEQIGLGSKITIVNQISNIASTTNELSVVKISASDYEDLVANDATLSNCIYDVENDYVDVYGEQIKNVAYPTDLSDAATKQYVDAAIQNIQIPTDLSDLTNSPNFATQGYVNQVLGNIETILNNL